MAAKKDYYEVLGVSRGSNDKEIKAAYRRLARKVHPDVNKGDPEAEERFKEVAEAFAVLSDPEKRARYDRGGHEAFGAGFDPFAGFDPQQFEFGFGNLSELLRMFGMGDVGGMGRGTHRHGAGMRGRDLRYETRIEFEDAVRGKTLELSIPRLVACPACGGRGATGSGPCPTCHGRGAIRREDSVRARIPAGVTDGTRVRLAGQGDAGRGGGPAGDLILVLRVTPHPRFRLDGRNLVCDVTVGLARAALGGTVEVPTLDGTARIQIPAGTRSGQRFRLQGRGLPAVNGKPAGDLHAILQIQPPRNPTGRTRELLEELARLEKEAAHL